MIDHIGFNVSHFPASRAVYTAALGALGNQVLEEGDGWAIIGRKGGFRLWIGQFGAVAAPIHIAWSAATRDEVHAFYDAAIAAGGRDNGAPGLRPNYAPNYYAAFVLDPDGNNIEAVTYSAT